MGTAFHGIVFGGAGFWIGNWTKAVKLRVALSYFLDASPIEIATACDLGGETG